MKTSMIAGRLGYRQRPLPIRMGYIRALKFLCPGVDRHCADFQQNKLLQVFSIYKLVYNLTVDAWRHCRDQGEAAENAWFEAHLPEWDKCGLFLSILPSRRETANLELAHWLTRGFFDMQPGAELENFVGWDALSAAPIIQRNAERALSFADEIRSELHVVERMKKSSPWRALQGESRFWVIAQVAQNSDLWPLAKQAAVQRLRDLASTPAQTVQVILLELDGHLNGERKHRSKDTQANVQSLLDEAEVNDEDTKRAYESSDDAYRVFRKMLGSGHPPDDWDQLLKEAKPAVERLQASMAVLKETE